MWSVSSWFDWQSNLRFGRVPGQRFIERSEYSRLSSSGSLNLIHVADGVQVIQNVSDPQHHQAVLGQTFIVCDGHPVERRDYYDFVAETLRAKPIPWDAIDGSEAKTRSTGLGKQLSNNKLLSSLSVEFQYPDYRAGVTQALPRDE